MRKFSSWVYDWYEDTAYPTIANDHTGYLKVPEYSDSDVIEEIKKLVTWYDEEVAEIEEEKYEYFESELKECLLPDEKIYYEVYDSTDCEYLEDLEDMDGNLDMIPGFRDK